VYKCLYPEIFRGRGQAANRSSKSQANMAILTLYEYWGRAKWGEAAEGQDTIFISGNIIFCSLLS